MRNIGTDLFLNMSEIKNLDLSHNQLASIKIGIHSFNGNLEKLDLSSNQINSFNISNLELILFKNSNQVHLDLRNNALKARFQWNVNLSKSWKTLKNFYNFVFKCIALEWSIYKKKLLQIQMKWKTNEITNKQKYQTFNSVSFEYVCKVCRPLRRILFKTVCCFSSLINRQSAAVHKLDSSMYLDYYY